MWITSKELADNGVLVYEHESTTGATTNFATHSTNIILACFDLDMTLIRPNGARIWARDAHDYVPAYDCVLERLTSISEHHGERIVIFTNQGWSDENKIRLFKDKVINMTNDLFKDVSFLLIAATRRGPYRKPQTGMFSYVVRRHVDAGYTVDMERSYYVGDMGGRMTDPNDTDRTFALNAGLRFYTPEEYFFSTPPVSFKLKVDLDKVPPRTAEIDYRIRSAVNRWCEKSVVIMLVGRPAAGKSQFVERYLTPLGFAHINQDTLKTKEKCLRTMKQVLQNPEGKKLVVVDNTNPSRNSREPYIVLSKEHKVPVVVLHFTTPLNLCRHNNAYRCSIQAGREIPDIAYRMYEKNYEIPTTEEGCNEVVHVDFYADEDMALWKRYYT